MKKFLLALFFIISTYLGHAQVYVDGKNLNDMDVTYIELLGVNTSLIGVKMKIYVDYGQKVKLFKPSKITTKDGKVKKFNTMMDALNFFYKNGWEFVQFSQGTLNGKLRISYLLKKREK